MIKEIDKENEQSLAQSLRDESHESAKVIRRVVTIGCCVNALLMCLKLCAGYFGHSEALMADGYHSLNDILSDIIMFVFVGISYRAADRRFAYGYGKFGTFSSMLMSVFLMFIVVMIAREGIESIVEYANGAELEQPDIWTFVVVLFAMACKEGLFRFYSRIGRKTGAKALEANAWHHRSDALASIATLIGVTFAHFFGPAFRVVDPCASLAIAVFIAIPAVKMFIYAFKELMDHSLPDADINKAMDILKEEAGVIDVKYLYTRRNGHDSIFDIGIVVKPDMTVGQSHAIIEDLKKKLRGAFCPHIRVSIASFPESK